MTDKRYLNFFGFLINYALLLVMSGSLLFRYESRFILITAVVLWIILTLIMRYRDYASPIIKSFLVLFLLIFFNHYFGYNFNRILNLSLDRFYELLGGERIVEFVNKVVHFYSEQPTYFPKILGEQIFIAVSTVVSLVTIILVEKRSVKVLLIIPPLFFMIQWIRYVDISFVAIRWYMIGFVGYLVHVMSHINNRSSSSRYSRIKSRDYFFYSMVIAIVIMMMTSTIFAFYPLEKINDKFSGFMPTFSFMRTGYTARSDQYIFSFESTMYQPNENRLGGRISNRNYDEVMLVESTKGAQYLRGRVKDQYTGYSWNTTHKTFNNRVLFEEKQIKTFEMTIYPTKIQTATLFAPLGIKKIALDINKVFVNQDEIFYYNRDALEKRLDHYSYEIYGEIVNHYMVDDYESYLQLPDNISERLRRLAILIASDEPTATKKVEALVSYLKENYEYTLFVNNVPYEAEFVDYFIFEEKKGYCTYFASALAIMARLNDIPSRYIEGYVTELHENDDGFYEVTGDRAHAWVEVYVDGLWKPVEATPYYIDEQLQNEYEVAVDNESETPVNERPEIDEEALEPDIPVPNTPETNNTFRWFYVILLIVILLISVLVVLIKKIYRKLSIEERLKVIIKVIETDELFVHHSLIPEKYINEYAMKNFGYKMTSETKEMLQKAIYSSLALKPDEKSIIIEEIEYLEKIAKAHFSRIKFAIVRFNYPKRF